MRGWGGWGEERFVSGCALIRSRAGTAGLPFKPLHPTAIPIVLLRWFAPVQHLDDSTSRTLLSPPFSTKLKQARVCRLIL